MKGIKIEEKVMITHIGNVCHGVPWETPCIYFLTSKHGECRWASEKINELMLNFEKGDIVKIRCFIYPLGSGYSARRVTFPALLK